MSDIIITEGLVFRDWKRTEPVDHVPASGICWACLHPGTAMEWWKHHLIHATEECRALAKSKPEQREHRG